MYKASEQDGAAMFVWIFHEKPYQQCPYNFYVSGLVHQMKTSPFNFHHRNSNSEVSLLLLMFLEHLLWTCNMVTFYLTMILF